MSEFTDYQEEQFFNHIARLQAELDGLDGWKNYYEKRRDKYPDWVTKDGQHIKVRDIANSHLDNLIPFVQKRDPENKTRWVDVLKSEKRYRTIDKEIAEVEREYNEYERVMDMVY